MGINVEEFSVHFHIQMKMRKDWKKEHLLKLLINSSSASMDKPQCIIGFNTKYFGAVNVPRLN